jgi:GNAT superfamily N-acetyltransferase
VSRSPVVVRPAETADVTTLRELWGDVLRKGAIDEQLSDLSRILADCAEHDDRMVAVAEVDGQVAGAVFLHATTLTPLNLDAAVLAVSPHVFPAFRRKGVGSALIEAAVRFAEQQGIPHVCTAANPDARDANRFMARLAFSPQATLRAASTGAVRARLTARKPRVRQVATARQIDRVLAARRGRREHVAG